MLCKVSLAPLLDTLVGTLLATNHESVHTVYVKQHDRGALYALLYQDFDEHSYAVYNQRPLLRCPERLRLRRCTFVTQLENKRSATSVSSTLGLRDLDAHLLLPMPLIPLAIEDRQTPLRRGDDVECFDRDALGLLQYVDSGFGDVGCY